MRHFRLPDPPLDPSGTEGRSALRRELLRPEYHQQNLVQEAVDWVRRRVSDGLDRAAEVPPLSTLAAMVVFVALVLALAWLTSRARRTARSRAPRGAVLTSEVVTAADLRARARAALSEGRHEEAVVEGFRALTAGQVERGGLADAPDVTAHEVAEVLATEHAVLAARLTAGAAVFDAVRYGGRPASRDQAVAVLSLDDDLAVRR